MFSSISKLNLVFSCAPRNVLKNILRTSQTSSAKTTDLSQKESSSDPDMFMSDIENPYERKKHVCIICKYKIPLDYKNPRLLSQFISPYTGFIYAKHITGLCDAQQKRLEMAIKRSREAGYMAHVQKVAKYLRDPKLFDPFAPSRRNPH